MYLNKESIDAYKTIMEDPAEYGFSFRKLKECFEASDEATPKHVLYDEYLNYINKPLPKVFFYIIMDGLYSQATAPNGYLGYKVTFKPEKKVIMQ